jgi:serine/threonine-protein kinase
MLNFIVAKALAKDLEHRYQNARDFANDLRACRDTMPRGAAPAPVPKPSSATSLAAATQAVADEGDESDQAVTMRLSPSFDSVGATMRLAALTASQEDVEELSKTFKMARPSVEEINRAAPQPQMFAKPLPAHMARTSAESRATKGGGLMLMAIIALILIGLISAFLF